MQEGTYTDNRSQGVETSITCRYLMMRNRIFQQSHAQEWIFINHLQAHGCAGNHKEVIAMKIGEAQRAYRQQLSLLRGQRSDYVKQQEEHRKKMEKAQADRELLGVKYEKVLNGLADQEMGIFNSIVAEQQADAMEEYGEEMAKCLEIARRLSRGDKVPAQDEKKLMEFNMDIYKMAKNMAALNMNKKHKEWDSLWEDDEEKKEYDDPLEAAENAETDVEMPEGMEAAAAEVSVE